MFAGDEEADAQCGILSVHRRALARLLAEAVRQCVLRQQRHILRMAETLRIQLGGEREGVFHAHEHFPRDLFDACIDVLLVPHREVFDRDQHPQRRAQAQVGLVQETEVAREGHRAVVLLHLLCAQTQQFLRQYRLQPVHRLGRHPEFVRGLAAGAIGHGPNLRRGVASGATRPKNECHSGLDPGS